MSIMEPEPALAMACTNARVRRHDLHCRVAPPSKWNPEPLL